MARLFSKRSNRWAGFGPGFRRRPHRTGRHLSGRSGGLGSAGSNCARACARRFRHNHRRCLAHRCMTKISFWHLFNYHLKPGGYYVIEDWRVSYSDAASDGARYEWPAPMPVGSPQAELPDHAGSSLEQVDQMGRRIKRMLDGLGGAGFTRVAARLYRRQKYKSRRFPSHDSGWSAWSSSSLTSLAWTP